MAVKWQYICSGAKERFGYITGASGLLKTPQISIVCNKKWSAAQVYICSLHCKWANQKLDESIFPSRWFNIFNEINVFRLIFNKIVEISINCCHWICSASNLKQSSRAVENISIYNLLKSTPSEIHGEPQNTIRLRQMTLPPGDRWRIIKTTINKFGELFSSFVLTKK